MAAKKVQGLGTVLRTPNQLQNIGKPNYAGVAEAMRATGYQGKKIVQK